LIVLLLAVLIWVGVSALIALALGRLFIWSRTRERVVLIDDRPILSRIQLSPDKWV
jgi:hypothetical protein